MDFSDIEVGMHVHDRYRPLVLGAVTAKTQHRITVTFMSGISTPYRSLYGCRTCRALVREE